MPGVAVLEWKAPACHSELELASGVWTYLIGLLACFQTFLGIV